MPAAAASRITFLPTVPAAVDTAPPPPPPTDTLTVDGVAICAPTACFVPLCQRDSIVVFLGGRLPNDCWTIQRVELWWPPIVSIRPFAPWVRVIADDGACSGRACSTTAVQWNARVVLPPLPEGPYTLVVAPLVTSCTRGDSLPPWPWSTSQWPFETVACDSDSVPPGACFRPWFPHPASGSECDAMFSAGTAEFLFGVHSDIPVAGVQGELLVSSPVARISDIRPIEPGWALRWSSTATGAKLVVFRTGPLLGPAVGDLPLVRVRLVVPTDVPVPERTFVYTQNVIASDPNGDAIAECILRSVPPHAVICAAPDCDANGDGATDVRDLVREVRCLRDSASCTHVYDCNGDGGFTLDDVLCCAAQILRVRPCTTCPPDSTPPKDVGVRITVGAPQAAAGGEVRVPITIAAADRIGAARLALPFPVDRWRVAGVDCDDAAWLTLADAVGSEAVVGVIRVGQADSRLVRPLELTLRLAPVGAAGGGELGTLSADVSGTDGAAVVSPVDSPLRPLPGGAAIELSANRPEPFSGTTRFTLSLPTAAPVDLGVFDLHGRRVATLHRGALAAGVTEFTWDGHADGGTRIGAGVYFIRCAAGAQALTRRVVFLGGR
jgi:hypothetical protein